MPAVQTKKLTPQTLGKGVYDPREFREFSPEEGTVVIMYAEDPDVGLVVWNLEPGQENSTHVHPDSAHIMWVLSGSGQHIRDGQPVPIKAGDCLVVPRGVVHGIVNNGNERLSYLAVTTVSETGYTRTPVGEQKVSIGGDH